MDEGQDLLNMADLNKLDGVLKGGFVNGQWYFFHDANNQSNLLAAVEPDALDCHCNINKVILLFS
jgi:hypothetical protein